jgi:hypothetical protein
MFKLQRPVEIPQNLNLEGFTRHLPHFEPSLGIAYSENRPLISHMSFLSYWLYCGWVVVWWKPICAENCPSMVLGSPAHLAAWGPSTITLVKLHQV